MLAYFSLGPPRQASDVALVRRVQVLVLLSRVYDRTHRIQSSSRSTRTTPCLWCLQDKSCWVQCFATHSPRVKLRDWQLDWTHGPCSTCHTQSRSVHLALLLDWSQFVQHSVAIDQTLNLVNKNPPIKVTFKSSWVIINKSLYFEMMSGPALGWLYCILNMSKHASRPCGLFKLNTSGIKCFDLCLNSAVANRRAGTKRGKNPLILVASSSSVSGNGSNGDLFLSLSSTSVTISNSDFNDTAASFSASVNLTRDDCAMVLSSPVCSRVQVRISAIHWPSITVLIFGNHCSSSSIKQLKLATFVLPKMKPANSAVTITGLALIDRTGWITYQLWWQWGTEQCICRAWSTRAARGEWRHWVRDCCRDTWSCSLAALARAM